MCKLKITVLIINFLDAVECENECIFVYALSISIIIAIAKWQLHVNVKCAFVSYNTYSITYSSKCMHDGFNRNENEALIFHKHFHLRDSSFFKYHSFARQGSRMVFSVSVATPSILFYYFLLYYYFSFQFSLFLRCAKEWSYVKKIVIFPKIM